MGGERTDLPGEGAASLGVVIREWTRLGCTGFGGPPAHIAMLRRLCVDKNRWLTEVDFESAIAATNLLPGPASTQLAIFCAWSVRGRLGAVVGGVCFIAPGLLLILLLASVFLGMPPTWLRGAAAGAGAAVPAVALAAALALAPASRRRSAAGHQVRGGTAGIRWLAYVGVGAALGALSSAYLVVALVCAGLVEVAARRAVRPPGRAPALVPVLVAPAAGGLGGLGWVALKVGLLSYGGGFVIIPLMQHDAVSRYHWMSGGQFLNAVALGQLTPGPVVQTVAVVGYAAAGFGGGLLAALVAFTPSFLLVLGGAGRFNELRESQLAQAFLTGAGAAVIGAIAGSSLPLAAALARPWQGVVLCLATCWLVLGRRGLVAGILGSAALGVVAAVAGLAVT